MRRAGGRVGGKAGGRVVVTWLLATALLPASPLAAQSTPESGTAALPAHVPTRLPAGSELTIYLMTMGVGAEVWERFGHNAIVVEDRSRGTSIAYNYGMFSFRQENFVLRFIQGRMDYWMAGYPAEDEVPRYREMRRSVWRQELNLPPADRLALRDFLEWNARPENRFYHYDYYLDNCSTRVRDALDRVLHGALEAQFQGPASGNFRFHTQRLVAANPFLYVGLALIEGQPVDRPNTRWEEMFLPLKVRDYLRTATITDSTGAKVPLVTREDTLYESTAFPVPDAPPNWLLPLFLIGSAIGGLFWWGGSRGRTSAPARYTLLVGGSFYALLTGVAAAIMAGLWAFTDHAVAGRNENVLQCSLVALLLTVALPFAIGDRPWALRWARGLALLIGGLSLAGVVFKVLPLFSQANWPVLALFVPANVGLAAGVVAWVGREK